MTIASAASAFPEHRYPQDVLVNELIRLVGPKLENPAFLRRMRQSVKVDSRYLALPLEHYQDLSTWGQANDAWIDAAERLGEQSLCRAISRAGIDRQEVDAIFFVSVTGIASPSIDARLVNRMGLSRNIKRVPIFGLGCVAGAAGIARAADYVRAFPNHVAAVVSVELCSLTLQREDLTPANLISSCLFGDGACTVLVAGANRELPGPRVLATRSVFYPNTQDVMGWKISEKGFGIVLSPTVPDVVKDNLAGDVDAFLADNGLCREDIGSWIIHTGGPKVLEATQKALELPEGALDASWECLRRVGNLSSASVLLVLEDYLTKRRPEPGSYSLLSAMGPAFCSELVLLRW